ncbi:tryptophan 2,3-dioxygenase [Frateuria aurantia]|uniref:Tryptophan 2,3-dioxygenase n=1 Tax=Frateuria aurantia (strain ATCC 33424 / DSM 6220 / KCTC 2777 / LMG 1558 / NBRC 3245 / NCIMB 13370) TaxID=767434 RepID=H8L408_FRAAD|nr:tryptophan 2,3-dioxygenase family protein [Frateuria aurantia]AFC85602.1 tryptophan 2,3-dioxygenase (vermilion) [Frateuria aurantia DSM 6220]
MKTSSREVSGAGEMAVSPESGYADYLQLDVLLSAQRPLSSPPQHDEMVFIVQHQVAELWMKLFVHELEAILAAVRADALSRAMTGMQRVKTIQAQLYEQWSVLETLSPVDYLKFRPVLGRGSGFQSAQYRELVFMLGEKNPDLLDMFADRPEAQQRLQALLEQPSLYQEWLLHLHRQGHAVPEDCLQGDWSRPRPPDERLWPVFRAIYQQRERYPLAYAFCEQLVDLEEQFQLWRFRHLKTVERVIGWRRGTGGSSGLDFLRQVLDQSFFPELLAIRTGL